MFVRGLAVDDVAEDSADAHGLAGRGGAQEEVPQRLVGVRGAGQGRDAGPEGPLPVGVAGVSKS